MDQIQRLITATIFALCIININVDLSEAQQKGGANEGTQQKGGATVNDGLQVGFYGKSCPNAEKVVADIVAKAYKQDQKLPASLLRLFFHDCFVKGCDASVLLDLTNSNEFVEKKSPANADALKGFELIDEIKSQLEKECPQTVSCADIIAFATRDIVVQSGLPDHQMPAGRRDSRTSRATDATDRVPPPTATMDDIIDIFARTGLNEEDVVALLGAHSIGTSSCNFFDYRLYNYNKMNQPDPNMDPGYLRDLSAKCPKGVPVDQSRKVLVDLDPVTPVKLDVQYYKNLLEKKGLLESDQAMVLDKRTKPIVEKMAKDPQAWAQAFVKALVKMGRNNVLTDKDGEIRKNCRAFNA